MVVNYKKIIEYLLDKYIVKYSSSAQNYINTHNTHFGDYILKPMMENSFVNQVLAEYRFYDLRRSDIVLDIGANVGGFCMFVSNTVNHVYAVEPLFTDVLKENIKNNGISNIDVLEIGLGQTDYICNFSSRRKMIKCVSLSDLIKMSGGKVDFLKCDCEGGEWCIKPHELNGVRRIEAEIHSFNNERLSDFPDMLKKLGYKVFTTKNSERMMVIHAHKEV